MSTPVKLYVYDLSNGLARQMSLQLTGRQIDGIWHTSVVVFGKEIFYGQGISITIPGKSHHGSPLQIVDMGETALDEETFQEYLTEMREHYTADKYHLLDFNCNSFTNDCVGFLTGGSIPSWIRDLPRDFLSTPFGAALRPTIDAMYRSPTAPGAVHATPPVIPTTPNAQAQLASSLLQFAASRATVPPPVSALSGTPATSTLTSPLHFTTNPASLSSLLSSHRAVAVFFTSPTCPPCRMVEPIFEDLSWGKKRVAFAKVDMAVGRGGEVAQMWNVKVTPTFLFFLDGKKIHELKGANAAELRTQIDLLIFQAYPPHAHMSLPLPSTRALSLEPILFKQVPPYPTIASKLNSSISTASVSSEKVRPVTEEVIPFLQSRFPGTGPKSLGGGSAAGARTALPPTLLSRWSTATATLVISLSPAELFPLVDLWRLALLDTEIASWCVSPSTSNFDPIVPILAKATGTLAASPHPRNFILTTLRMLSNAFSNTMLAQKLLASASSGRLSPRQSLTSLLVPTLLHADSDPAIRTAAASLAFNVAAHCQRMRSSNDDEGIGNVDEANGDWEVEVVSAVVEALGRETQSEEVVHRLTASLALFTYLSPSYETHLAPLLDVLQVRALLRAKLEKGGCGEKGVEKKEVRKLIEEVADKLCH